MEVAGVSGGGTPLERGLAEVTSMARGSALATAFPPIWLRDNCPCALCRDATSHQKLIQIFDLPDSIEVSAVTERDSEIEFTFLPDHHRSTFSRAWLLEHTPFSLVRGRNEDSKRLWRASDLDLAQIRSTWHAYRSDPRERLRVLRGVGDLGFALLSGTSVAPGTVLEIASTFGFVRETNYGKLFDVRVEADPSNLAFTGRAITPHTDNPYRDPVPTMQLLHCLSNSVDGGESGLVDGFMAAALLRSEDERSFLVLASTPVEFAWSDADHSLRAARPLIELDEGGRVRAVRYNNRSMQALRFGYEGIVDFYAAYRRFAGILLRPELELAFRLGPGDCVIFDNTRLMHSRTAFDESGAGSRHLQGCYADLDGLESTIEILERA